MIQSRYRGIFHFCISASRRPQDASERIYKNEIATTQWRRVSFLSVEATSINHKEIPPSPQIE